MDAEMNSKVFNVKTEQGARDFLESMGINPDQEIRKGKQIIEDIHHEIEIKEALKTLGLTLSNNVKQ